MATLQFNVSNPERHGRISVLFRSLLAVPHVVVGGLWSIGIGVLTFIQWFIIVITGHRSASIWTRQNRWLSYATRVKSYQCYLFDAYPRFGGTAGSEPITYEISFETDARRLSTFFRGLLLIPAYFALFFRTIAVGVVLIPAWFALMLTGRFPSGMHGFVVKCRRLSARVSAYAMYMTDEYPNAF